MSVATVPSVLHLHPEDNVVVATRSLSQGTSLPEIRGISGLTTREQIDLGHKIAIRRVDSGAPIRKFGQTIGFATREIQPGEWVHTQNVEAGQLSLDYAYCSEVPPDPTPLSGRYFQGYRRADGRAATRNYL